MVLAVLVRSRASNREGQVDESFQVLYRQHYRQIWGFFRNKTRSTEECEDLVQETFLRAYRRFGEFRGEAKESTWLHTIAANLWINRIRDARAAKRDAEEVDLETGTSVSDPGLSSEQVTMDRERRRLLRSAIDELPLKMRLCVEYRVYHEKGFAEIAQLVGISEGTARSHCSRAADRLRPQLAESYPDLSADLKAAGDS